MHPEVFYLKEMLRDLTVVKKKEIFMFLDIHGTMKTGCGSYLVGCETNRGLHSRMNWVFLRLFGKLLREKMQHFNYGKCSFHAKDKSKSTAR